MFQLKKSSKPTNDQTEVRGYLGWYGVATNTYYFGCMSSKEDECPPMMDSLGNKLLVILLLYCPASLGINCLVLWPVSYLWQYRWDGDGVWWCWLMWCGDGLLPLPAQWSVCDLELHRLLPRYQYGCVEMCSISGRRFYIILYFDGWVLI